MFGRTALILGGVALVATAGCASMRGGTTRITSNEPNGGIIVESPDAVAASPVTAPPATVVTTPSGGTVAVTTTAPPAPEPLTAMGTVASVDGTAGVIRLTDGRAVLLGPKSAVFGQGHPVNFAEVTPGMDVTVTQVSPVVYRDGRYALLNPGFRDSSTGWSVGVESRYHGLDADTAHAGMQVQAGGGGAGS
jgi:hypothetical protein